MIYELLKPLWNKVKFNQKEEWDTIAYSYLDNTDSKPILDAGSGIGRFIAQNHQRIVGIDWNRNSLKDCKAKGYNVIEADVRDLPFEDEAFSGVHCSHVIEHFSPMEVHEILSEMNRVLCDGGVLVIRSPLLWDGFYSDLTHVRPYNPGAIMHYLAPSRQRTLPHISVSFKKVQLMWRYKSLRIGMRLFNAFFNCVNRWGFPWLRKNGYMLVMQKILKTSENTAKKLDKGSPVLKERA